MNSFKLIKFFANIDDSDDDKYSDGGDKDEDKDEDKTKEVKEMKGKKEIFFDENQYFFLLRNRQS